jgi:hypothetical protein
LAFSAQAPSFGAKTMVRGGQPHGIVTCLGADLFELTVPAGGLTAPRRAEVVAERLNLLEATHELTPAQFSVGFRNGEVIIQHHQHAEHQPHIVVTIDRALSRQIPGARGQAERLAQWWLALFRDRLALLNHEMPYFTAGTPVAEVFSKIYAQLKRETKNPDERRAALRQAIENLSPPDRQLFLEACYRVPEEYDPNRIIVVVAQPGAEEHGHKDETKEAENGRRAVPTDETKSKPLITPPVPPPAPPAKAEEHHEEKPEAKNEAKITPPVQTMGAAAGTRSVVSGKTRVTLLTDLPTLSAGKETEIQLKLTDTTKKDPVLAEEESIPDALVRCWFVRGGEGSRLSPPIPAEYDKDKEIYGFGCTFPVVGTYRLIVGALTPSAEVLKVEFTLPVQKQEDAAPAAAVAPETKKEEPSTTNPPQRPMRTGSARDYVVARRTPDNMLELGWQQEQPAPRSVTFILRGNGGKELSSKKLTSPPFAAKFPIPQGLTEIRLSVEYASGVVHTVVLPFAAVK